MGQIVFNGQKPKYCNLTAITTGSKKDYLIPDGEIWLIDSTNTSKTDGTGKYDYYIKGDGSNTASQLAANKIKVDDSIDISGKADKSEMSVVAGTGANADKTTITLKSGTSATVLTQHQDVSGKEDKSNKVTSFSSPTDTQYPSAKLVSDQLATKQGTISDLSTIRSNAAAGATAYQKPGTGIPSTDFTSAVQTSLGKADTAIQSVTVGTTTTGAAGTNASVVNGGTATAPVLNFTIPQGAQGVKGDTVIMGGESSYTLYNTTGDAVDGAMTQQAVTRELTELSGEIHKLDGLTEPIPMSYTEGKYINSAGDLVSDASWMASDFLDISTVAAGDIFVWSGIKNKPQACLVFYAEDGTLMQPYSALNTSRTITIANKDAAIGATKVRASFLIDGVPSLTHNNADVLANNIHYTIRGLDNVANGLDNLSKTVENDVLFKRYPSILNNNDFVQGVNNLNGEIISSTKRCITPDLYDMNEDTIVKVVNNGQYHLMLTYDTDGTYRGVTTGWVATDATYTFNEACKVRFLVSWDGRTIDRDIIPSEITVVFTINKPLEIVLKTDELYSKIGKSISTISGIKNCNDSFCRFNKTIKVYNPYKNHPTNQYKGQMHCHTTNSDGALAPSAVVAKYVGYGYDFMTITDHNHITPNPSPESDIVWMGDSYEDTHNTAGLQHMNVWNCSKVGGANTPSSLVDFFVKNGDSVLSYNHPEYPPVYASDDTLENLPDGISFVEIYNSTIQTYLGEVSKLPDTANFYDMVKYNGKRYINASITKESPNWIETTETSKPDGNLDRGFRIMLDSGKKVFCDAVDDFHRGNNMENRGWQMVFAHSRTKQSIWNGLLTGASYASTGVSLNDISFVDGMFRLEIANGDNAVTTFYGFNNEVLGTSNGSTATYEATGSEKYIRAMVEIGGMKAWTQPIWIIDVGNQYEF